METYLKETKQLWKIAKPLIKQLGLDDWDIKIAYSNSASENMADCEPVAEYKRAKITFYTMDKADETMYHELLHCRVATILGSYNTALDSMTQAIKDIIQRQEEELVTDLTTVYMGKQEKEKPLKKKGGKKR